MKFQLINKVTKLTLGQHKSRHPLRYYFNDKLTEDMDFQQIAIRALIRCDGAIGFQQLKTWYDEGELYFLPRDDWDIVMVPETTEFKNEPNDTHGEPPGPHY